MDGMLRNKKVGEMAEWASREFSESTAFARRAPDRKLGGVRIEERQTNAKDGMLRNREVGEMAEWLNAAVLKTVEANNLPGFESLSLRQID